MIKLDFDRERSFAFVTVEGDLSDGEVLAWFDGFVAALKACDRVGGVVDARSVGRLDVTSEKVRRMTQVASRNEAIFAGSRWALVSDQDAVFGLSRMYEMLRADAEYQIGVFRSMQEALDWVDGG